MRKISQKGHRCKIVEVNCEEDGELTLTLEDIDDNCFCAHPSDYYSELRVKPTEMEVLKQKYGMMWNGTKESAKAFEGKIIEYPVIPRTRH